jgi:hypothetical protein
LALVPTERRRPLLAEACDPAGAALLVAARGHWLRPPGGEPVDLAPRPLLARFVQVLLSARRGNPLEWLTLEALFERVWPGEKAVHEAMANRVHSNLSVLRKLGLGALLLNSPSGWALDPQTPLVILEDEMAIRV